MIYTSPDLLPPSLKFQTLGNKHKHTHTHPHRVQEVLGDELSVYKVVEKMRQQRPAMVQAKDQYVFVYLAVAELSKRALGMKPNVPRKPNGRVGDIMDVFTANV